MTVMASVHTSDSDKALEFYSAIECKLRSWMTLGWKWNLRSTKNKDGLEKGL